MLDRVEFAKFLCALQSESNFIDGEVLPTMLENSNVTIMVDEVNNTEIVTVISYASEATVVTPAAYACNVSSTAVFLSFLQCTQLW